jgi:glycosyltransferase involved in cell wall biosynthesis
MVEVTIIIPCFNGSRFIQSTIESAVRQTRPPLEVIVIDDGSTDDSAVIAERFGPPVRVIRQSNHGESFARNRGVEAATGTHVLFLDADDLLAPRSLEHMAGALDDRPGALALMGCCWFTSDPEKPEREMLWRYDRFYPSIIESNLAPCMCWLAPRDTVARAGGFCETLHWFEDWDLWWRVGLDEPPLISVPYVGALYRQHAQSQLSTTSAANRARGHLALLERLSSAFLQRREMLSKYGDQVFWCGWTALKRAQDAAVPWKELAPLATNLREIAATGPDPVRRSRTARLVRLVGARLVLTVS